MQQRLLLSAAILFFSVSLFGQPTNTVTSPEKKYNDAKAFFAEKQYSLAYPLLRELKDEFRENQKSNHTYINEDVDYYFIVSGLLLQLPVSEKDAKHFVETVTNTPRKTMMYFHLGRYYFSKNNFEGAVESFTKTDSKNLDKEEQDDMKFELAYSYFNLKKISDARPLFDELHQMQDSKYYMPSNYYYGFISYYNGQFIEAMQSFRLVESEDAYRSIVPYYISEILYFQKKKDESLVYTEQMLSRGGLYYEKEMKQLAGQIYFERKEFSKALPLLEYYFNNSNKVTKENLYELSYCYYQTGQVTNAIKGFKQLSNEKDSLGQNSMYLLADCYIKSNEKENARNAFQFCAGNSSNRMQQEISAFNYAKLSYDLGYQDIALKELQNFISGYKTSVYAPEAKEILVNLLANTNNFSDALALYESFDKPSAALQKQYPKILYGRAVEYMNEQQTQKADELFTKILEQPVSTVTPYANFWKGELLFQSSKYDEAIRSLNLYLQSNVSQGEINQQTAKYNIGYCWFKKELYKQALPYFEQVSASLSATSGLQQDAVLRCADCYFMMKDFSKAGILYDGIINNASVQSDYAFFQKALIAGVKSSGDKIKILSTLTRNYPQSNLVAEANMEIANTYMSDEKFSDAMYYLNNILVSASGFGFQPKAYLKLGLCNYNTNNNTEALNNYKQLIQKFPLSPEADEAVENIRNIYIEENRPNEFVELMRKNGKPVAVSEADSLTYSAAELKYSNNDCAGSIAGFTNYLKQFPAGFFVLQANYFLSDCYQKNKDWSNALAGYDAIISKGLNKYYEKSALASARINYFEIKDYAAARKNFELLKSATSNSDNQLEALRGLVRCYYQLKDYTQANVTANELLSKKGVNADDKAVAYLVLGKSQQQGIMYDQAIVSFKSCAAINKSSWGAEARYEAAHCYFILNSYFNSEKAALSVIKETGSYDFWVTRSYILLGDIYLARKDYFNAKATYQSVAQNSIITELKNEAQQKFDKVLSEESTNSKINN